MTLPIIGREWYKRFGYLYNPVYKSLFCDNEMQDMSGMLDCYYYDDRVIVEHRHPLWVKEPYDDLMKHTESFYGRDGEVYKVRQSRNFNLLSAGRDGSLGKPLYLQQREPRQAGPLPRSRKL